MSDIVFADVNAGDVEAAVLTTYERLAGTTLYPGDPVRLFLESLAYTLTLQNNVINLAGRQNLLAYARGDHLDYIGMMVSTARLGKSRSRTTQRFAMAAALDFDVRIPSGTRVSTADGAAMFATEAEGVIPAGSLFADAPIAALKPGAASNGLLPGQIDRIIDPLPYISATRNVTMTMLGSDVESDERYRARIRMAPEAYTCAGPEQAYRYHAMSVHQDIAEAAVWSPKPGVVEVRPVMQGGELPSADVLDDVRKALSAEDVRPLTDTVIVQAPEPAPFDIRLTWYLSRSRESLLATTRAAVEAAVDRYRRWQRAKPGRDILPLQLLSLLEQAGARRVDLNEPKYLTLQPYQLARERIISITYGGVEDD